MTRRGACPTLASPMMTGDGLLVRLALERPGLSAAALAEIAAAAADHGNGLIDVSARGNIQIRGLSDISLPLLTKRIEALNIISPDSPAIAINALAGVDPAIQGNPLSTAQTIRDLIAACRPALQLAPKIAIVIDGGGALPLDALTADIRLVATDGGWSLALGGDALSAIPLAMVDDADAGLAVLLILKCLASRGNEARARHILESEGLAYFASALTPIPQRPPAPTRKNTGAAPIGRHRFGPGHHAIGIGLPFGQIDATTLGRLAEAAGPAAGVTICPAPGRALIVTGLTPAHADALTDTARELGLIVDPADPRLAIAACSGQPACASAHFDTRAVALYLAGALTPGAGSLHISGCAKGCAHPDPARLTIIGWTDGIGIVADGRASDPPSTHLPPLDPAGLAARITELLESKT